MNAKSGYGVVDFGESLEHECAEIGRSRPLSCRVTLTCSAARTQVPLPAAASLLTAAQILVRNAYEAFGDGGVGRIGVSFLVAGTTLELQIEHSHPVGPAAANDDCEGSTLLRDIVACVDGRIEARKVIGGRRWLVTVPVGGERQPASLNAMSSGADLQAFTSALPSRSPPT